MHETLLGICKKSLQYHPKKDATTLSIKPLSTLTFGIKRLSIRSHFAECPYAECHYTIVLPLCYLISNKPAHSSAFFNSCTCRTKTLIRMKHFWEYARRVCNTIKKRRHDTQHKNTQHNDIWRKKTQHSVSFC